ncbi:MAG TPA: hypothetical protein VHS03_00900 [Gaiellaceae bacterium]|nr:hypothetical protein [Gaiellaceae bacterium]
MYATVRRYDDPGLAAQLEQRRDEVLGVVSGLAGFRSYVVIAGESETITVSVYDDEASADASTKAARSWLSENMPDVAPPSSVAAGRVLVSA